MGIYDPFDPDGIECFVWLIEGRKGPCLYNREVAGQWRFGGMACRDLV